MNKLCLILKHGNHIYFPGEFTEGEKHYHQWINMDGNVDFMKEQIALKPE